MARTSRSRANARGGTAAGAGGSGTAPGAGGSGTPPGKPTGSGTGSRSRNDTTGGARRGRRDRARPVERSFLERHRTAILGGAVVAAVAIVAVFFLMNLTAPAYACSAQFPAPASADPSNQGAIQDDLGRSHVAVGTSVTYALCPPASGNHYSAAGQGPIQPKLYGPSDAVIPQGWVHNLEHGGLVVLYRCQGSDPGCADTAQSAMKSFVDSFPASPVCRIPAGQISPVVARFDQMPKPYAALVWGRVLYLDSFDTNAILSFFDQEAERTNPEPQCPSPSPGTASPAASGGSPAASGSSPAASGGGSSPATSPSTEPSPGTSPSPSPS